MQPDPGIAPATHVTAAPAGAVDAANATGLYWGLASLALDVIEVLVLTEIVFFDKPRIGAGGGFGFLQAYFVVTVAAAAGQALGVYLVACRWYRLGGILQIASSAVQVVKLDGIPGVIGGIKAYRFSQRPDFGPRNTVAVDVAA